MINFNKISSGTIKNNGKSLIISSHNMSRISTPYLGEVIKINSKDCNSGYLLIRHIINKKYYYSQFCGIGNLIVGIGDYVIEGNTIGYFSNESIKYSFFDENLKHISFNDSLTYGRKVSDNNLKPKKDKEKEKERDTTNLDGSAKFKKTGLLGLALSPLDVLNRTSLKAGDDLKKVKSSIFKFKDEKKDDRLKKAREDNEKEENNQSLNENIQKIKKLMK
jgi:hypothetical protein